MGVRRRVSGCFLGRYAPDAESCVRTVFVFYDANVEFDRDVCPRSIVKQCLCLSGLPWFVPSLPKWHPLSNNRVKSPGRIWAAVSQAIRVILLTHAGPRADCLNRSSLPRLNRVSDGVSKRPDVLHAAFLCGSMSLPLCPESSDSIECVVDDARE